jgi:hypothetical protein
VTFPNYPALKAHAWTRPLVRGVVALLAFETFTGLANYLLPFSVPNQVMVLLHTTAGLVLIVPYVAYQWRHWRIYKSLPTTHVSFTGYFAMAMVLLLMVSGVVLTVQAAMWTRISPAWDVAHPSGAQGHAARPRQANGAAVLRAEPVRPTVHRDDPRRDHPSRLR